MPNPQTTELIATLGNTAAMQRTIGLKASADMLDRAATTISDLDAALAVERAMNRGLAAASIAGRVITTRDEALALRAGAVVVNGPGQAFQIKPTETADSGYIDHATAAWLLPLTVVHEGNPT